MPTRSLGMIFGQRFSPKNTLGATFLYFREVLNRLSIIRHCLISSLFPLLNSEFFSCFFLTIVPQADSPRRTHHSPLIHQIEDIARRIASVTVVFFAGPSRIIEIFVVIFLFHQFDYFPAMSSA